jgi:preprotein translocase subunit SecA
MINMIVETSIPAGAYPEQWDLKHLREESLRLLGLQISPEEWAEEDGIAEEEIRRRLIQLSDERMDEKEKRFTSKVMRLAEKSVLLQVLDQTWKEHLLALDHLRQGIGLRSYAQQDPLNEYKREAFAMFEGMLTRMRESVTHVLSYVEPHPISAQDLFNQKQDAAVKESRQDPALAGQGASSQGDAGGAALGPVVKRGSAVGEPLQLDPNNPQTWGRVPRNAPCPCGSGQKFKHCHGKS